MFPSVQTAIEDCERHLDDSGARNSPIDVYLAGFLLIHIYASIDEKVKTICRQRCLACGDDSIGIVAVQALRPRRGEVKISDLGDVLKKLDDTAKSFFIDTVTGKPCQNAWDNILLNRHDFAHKSAYPQVTVADVSRFYSDAIFILEQFEKAIMISILE